MQQSDKESWWPTVVIILSFLIMGGIVGWLFISQLLSITGLMAVM